MKVISGKEMARLDRESSVSSEKLMERAGKGMAEFIVNKLPQYPVCFICGVGNNGGDGMVAARHLIEHEREVEIYLYGEKNKLKQLPRKQSRKLDQEIWEIRNVSLDNILDREKIVVDCVLGTGVKLPLRQDLRDILEIINKKSKITISCDIPTGVDPDTGEADEYSANADFTLTFEYPKTGHIKRPGRKYSGSIEVIKIDTGLSPEEYIEQELTVKQDCLRYFEKRNKESHKKNYGHILIIGGSPGMEGAVIMSAGGAQRAGAGLVTCAIGEKIYNPVASNSISSMELLLDDSPDGFLKADNLDKILNFARNRKIDCAVIGPGMGTGESSKELTEQLIKNLKCPIVLDADGLNNIAGDTEILKQAKEEVLITPHPGEMTRLTGKQIKEILDNRIEISKQFSNENNCTVILKGYRTLVTNGKKVFLNSTGNPGMAAGGTGDVLSGICASLIAQGMEITEAAKTAVWVHGRAGDLSASQKGQRYIVPEDLLDSLSKV